jgi:ABC-type transport system involved in Fe-S cluster assembly fused permease/ATPase subunit
MTAAAFLVLAAIPGLLKMYKTAQIIIWPLFVLSAIPLYFYLKIGLRVSSIEILYVNSTVYLVVLNFAFSIVYFVCAWRLDRQRRFNKSDSSLANIDKEN